jgi:hypothetical protein
MSHFTVLVATKNEQELEAKLLPYHEYECTGIEQYIEWVDHTSEVTKGWEEEEGPFHPDTKLYDLSSPKIPVKEAYENIDEFARKWYGYEKRTLDDGTTSYGRMTNPNAQWDWYIVGGRWAGALIDKSGEGRSVLPTAELDLEATQENSGKGTSKFPCFAFIDQEGKWNQRAKMLWFGCTNEDEATDDFDSTGLTWIDDCMKQEGMNFYLVDCHI